MPPSNVGTLNIYSFLDKGMLAVLKEMLNFKLLFNPLFFLIGVSNAVGMIGFYTPFVYLPSMAAQYVCLNSPFETLPLPIVFQESIGVEDAAFLVSVIGISNTLGRVMAGWLSGINLSEYLNIDHSEYSVRLLLGQLPGCDQLRHHSLSAYSISLSILYLLRLSSCHGTPLRILCR